MAQFDVHRNTAASKARVPYLLDVQADLLARLATRMVIPLVRPAEIGDRPIGHLHVEVVIKGHRFFALTSEAAAIPRSALGPRVQSVADQRAEILRAFDLLLCGL